MCRICNNMQRLTGNPDYLCTSCAHAKLLDNMLDPYSAVSRTNILTVKEVLAKYDRPLWAQALCIRTEYAATDYAPYYWIGDGQYKRVTSKLQRWELDQEGDVGLEIIMQFETHAFKYSFFEELRHATMLEF